MTLNWDLEATLLLTATGVFMLWAIDHAAHLRARRVILLYLLSRRATWAPDLRVAVNLGSRFDPAVDSLMDESLVERSQHVETLQFCMPYAGRHVSRRYRYDLTPDGLNVALDLRFAEEGR